MEKSKIIIPGVIGGIAFVFGLYYFFKSKSKKDEDSDLNENPFYTSDDDKKFEENLNRTGGQSIKRKSKKRKSKKKSRRSKL
jgi:hypothetical protein